MTRKSRQRAAAAIAALAFTATSPTLARAQSSSGVAQSPSDVALVQRGIELRRLGKDEEALELFVRADAASPSARTKAQIGLAEQALGRWVRAEQHVQEALASTKESWIQKNHVALEGSLREIQAHLATLEIVTDAPNARLFVDGEERGAANGASVRTPSGTVVIEVRAPTYTTARRVVDLPPNAKTRERFVLLEEPTEAPPVASPIATSQISQAVPPMSALTPRATPPDARRAPWAAYGAFAVGAGALSVGAYFGVRTFVLKGDRDDACIPRCTQAAVEFHNRAQTAATISTVAIGVAVASVGVGTWLFLRTGADTSAPTLGFTPTLGGGRVEGTF